MTFFFLRIYDWFAHRRRVLWLLLAAAAAVSVFFSFRLRYNENIFDFLPLENRQRKALDLYQHVSGTDRIFAMVRFKDTSETDYWRLVQEADRFVEEVGRRDTSGLVSDIITRMDYGGMQQLSSYIYSHIPYFLTEADYVRFDSLIGQEGLRDYAARQMERNRAMLMLPTGSMVTTQISHDPLALFTPVVSGMRSLQGNMPYWLYNGHVFSPDKRVTFVMMKSAYGGSETKRNAALVALLDEAAQAVTADFQGTEIHLIGAPVIAVENARCIKKDSMRSIAVSFVLIMTLLLVVFRRRKDLLLIVAAIAFGWLFAMGWMGVIRDEVSIIVLGISSVIIGIAVNYPLHFVDHLRHESGIRETLREVAGPLLTGNITTVGAFLCLVPMTAPALKDLGLFAAFMLVGTILFVIIFLPHMTRRKTEKRAVAVGEETLVRAEKPLRGRGWVLLILVALTVFLGYRGRWTGFDTDMNHINYMTETQKADFAYLERVFGSSGKGTVYVVSEGTTGEESLEISERMQDVFRDVAKRYEGSVHRGVWPFLPSRVEQEKRLRRWSQWVDTYASDLRKAVESEAAGYGFSDGAFAPFFRLLDDEFPPVGTEEFLPFMEEIAGGYLCENGEVVDCMDLPWDSVASLKAYLQERVGDKAYCFDVREVNSALSNSLSDDFNYICWACAILVFVFLWLSFGSVELSVLAFLPMAVGWVWILGIMHLTGIQFNLVNIILATFIFGQGDDYTIFMTEGLLYEYTYGKKLLKSYKHGIILSALIMLVGMGVLVIARHPAVKSLGGLTIIGMFVVVFMAYVLPPFVFHFLIRKRDGSFREKPVTLRLLLSGGKKSELPHRKVVSKYDYKADRAASKVRKMLRKYGNFKRWIDGVDPTDNREIVIVNGGMGVFGILLAWRCPDRKVTIYEGDGEKRALIRNLTYLPANLRLKKEPDTDCFRDGQVFLFEPTAAQKEGYGGFPTVTVIDE